MLIGLRCLEAELTKNCTRTWQVHFNLEFQPLASHRISLKKKKIAMLAFIEMARCPHLFFPGGPGASTSGAGELIPLVPARCPPLLCFLAAQLDP